MYTHKYTYIINLYRKDMLITLYYILISFVNRHYIQISLNTYEHHIPGIIHINSEICQSSLTLRRHVIITQLSANEIVYP